MKNGVKFFWAWSIYSVVLCVASFFALLLISKTLGSFDYFVDKPSKLFTFLILNGNIYWLWFVAPISVVVSVLTNRLEVSPEWNVIAEWKKEVMKPFKPGWYYPFPYFGYFEAIAAVPMNKQTVSILSGEKTGLDPQIINEFVYGAASNLGPKGGEPIRLLSKIEIQCVDPILIAYKVDDPYEYAASVIEVYLRRYASDNDNETIIRNFSKQDITIVPIGVRSQLLADTGIELISFIPVDVIEDEKTNKRRSDEYEEQQRSIFITAKNSNDILEEQGKGGVMKVTLTNKEIEENISKKDDEMLANRVKTIMASTGVSGDEALKIAMKAKTLETVATASESGSIVYIDENGGNGGLSQGASLGFAINATNQKQS